MVNFQTLVFRTTSKTTTLYEDKVGGSINTDFSFDRVSTVAVRDGFYEIMVKKTSSMSDKVTPAARLPIACTNMIILDE
jgi:hypothetical protein